MPSAPAPLADQRQFADFDSAEPSLGDWLKRRAAKNQPNGSSRTSVVCEGPAQIRVIGQDFLAAWRPAPSAMQKRGPR